jgi:hypothetical protein
MTRSANLISLRELAMREKMMSRRPDVPCSVCGALLFSSTTSLPPAERVCQPCRRRRREDIRADLPTREARTLVCPRCGVTFETVNARQIYCSPRCKQNAKYARRPKPPPKARAPRAPLASCVDCAARIPRHVVTSEPPLCVPCQTLRRAQLRQRHRRDKAGGQLSNPGQSRWRRLLARVTR